MLTAPALRPRLLHTAAALALGAAGAVTATAAEVRVHLDTAPAGGNVVLMLFDSANAFGDFRDPLRTATFPADGAASFTLDQVPAGEYALVVHHDLDGDGVLDKNFIGIPTEPLAFSNRYQPKGPPSYQRARFTLGRDQVADMALDLYRALGRRGRVGVGVGVIGRTSPYRDDGGGVAQVIPAVTYMGDRIQAYGPSLQVGLAGTGKLRLAATATYRIGVYEEADSPYLEGMGDRESTLMAGLGLQVELPAGLDLVLRVEADVLDRIGGTAAQLRLDKSFQLGITRLVPQLAVNWLSADLANHDFGVPVDRASSDRPAYRLGDLLSVEVGVGSFVELSRDWRIVLDLGVELFDDEVPSSPIVEEDVVVKGFLALNYVF